MTSGSPVATAYTWEFIKAHIPAGAKHLLEIGCGGGELASRLAEDGLAVVAIDADADCVEAARRRGVEARQLQWPASLDQRFDAVLFTRSLRHVDDLDESIGAARQVLRPGGRLIIEDFRSEGVPSGTADWYRSLVRLLDAAGAFANGTDLEELLSAPDPGDHHLHSSLEIEAALSSFARVEASNSAYFFRYLEPVFRQVDATRQMLEHELELLERSVIAPLGRRFVAEA